MVKQSLIIFAKEPALGRVKTRLAQSLGDEATLACYKAFVMDIVEHVRLLEIDQAILAFDDPNHHPEFLTSIASDFDFIEQQGDNLGERMHRAFVQVHDTGAEHMVIIGTDSPDLPQGILQQAFDSLKDHDVVLGPTQDGGYYLIGLNKPQPHLFSDVIWSTDNVWAQTLDNAKCTGLKVKILEEWYDIDFMDDLKRLWHNRDQNAEQLKHTQHVLTELDVEEQWRHDQHHHPSS